MADSKRALSAASSKSLAAISLARGSTIITIDAEIAALVCPQQPGVGPRVRIADHDERPSVCPHPGFAAIRSAQARGFGAA